MATGDSEERRSQSPMQPAPHEPPPSPQLPLASAGLDFLSSRVLASPVSSPASSHSSNPSHSPGFRSHLTLPSPRPPSPFVLPNPPHNYQHYPTPHNDPSVRPPPILSASS